MVSKREYQKILREIQKDVNGGKYDYDLFDGNVDLPDRSYLAKLIPTTDDIHGLVDDILDRNAEYIDDCENAIVRNIIDEYGFSEDDIDKFDIRSDIEEIVYGGVSAIFDVKDLFDYDIVVLDNSRTYEITTDGISLSATSVNKDKDYRAFKTKALKYISDKDFKALLDNAATSYGVGMFGVIVHSSVYIDAILNGEPIASDDIIVIVHNYMEGSGYYVHGNGSYSIKIENAVVSDPYDRYSVAGLFDLP